MSRFGELILSRLSRDPNAKDILNDRYEEKHKSLQPAIDQFNALFPNIREDISGNKVLDIGCSEGLETIAIASIGASEVVGIDIRIDEEGFVELTSKLAPSLNVSVRTMDGENTEFSDESFDRIVSLGSFEHFKDPKAILVEANRLLNTGGKVYITSGVWNHPYGAHMNYFTKAPWIQFIFSEETIMNVRRQYRSDGANKFHEVEGGLNDVGIYKFKRFAQETGFSIEYLYLNPVYGLSILTKIPYINEFFTNLIVAVLRKD